MALETLDVDKLAEKTDGNLYEAVVILSKRARQIATKRQEDLNKELSYFEGFESDQEETFSQEEQARISKKYETKPKPTKLAIDDMLNDDIYFRNPAQGEEETEAEELE